MAGSREPNNLVRQELSYIENKIWMNEVKSEGYTVIDLGNPNNLPTLGDFYPMETEIVVP